jgi:hypothetical protein
VEVIIPRRDREHPEFESSSEEEDEDGNRRKKVKSDAWAKEKKPPDFVEPPKTPVTPGSTTFRPAAQGTWQPAAGQERPPLPSEPPPEVDASGRVVRPVSADGPLRRKSVEMREQEAEKMLKDAMRDAERQQGRRDSLRAWDKDISAAPTTDRKPSLPLNQEAILSNDGVPPPDSTALPPTTPKQTADDLRLARELPRGRISIKCNEGTDFRRKDDVSRNPRTDPYIRFRLGVAEKNPWKMTETKRKQTENPKFGGEIVYFDVMEPADFVIAGDLQLVIEVYNKGSIKDELLGAVTMSVVRFFRSPFVTYAEKIPVYLPGQQFTKSKVLRL